MYHDCELVDAEIEYSVVLEHSRILGISGIQDSLIGKEVVVQRTGHASPGHAADARRPLDGRSRLIPTVLCRDAFRTQRHAPMDSRCIDPSGR